MNKLIDQEYLRKDQYKTSAKLQDRMQLHDRFSTNPRGWLPWVFDQLKFPERARLLDLGCGPGRLWERNRTRIPAGWEIALTDFSPGMIEAAQSNLGAGPFAFRVADAQDLPFDDGEFDGVVANHMLYHVPDRLKALREIRRVLKAGGCLYAATNGRPDGPSLRDWTLRAFPHLAERESAASIEHFKLENGADLLSQVFDQVEVHLYEDALEITEVEPLVAYLQSTARMALEDDKLGDLRRLIAAEIEQHGCLRLEKKTGIFVVR